MIKNNIKFIKLALAGHTSGSLLEICISNHPVHPYIAFITSVLLIIVIFVEKEIEYHDRRD